jgi:hypothetical protein
MTGRMFDELDIDFVTKTGRSIPLNCSAPLTDKPLSRLTSFDDQSIVNMRLRAKLIDGAVHGIPTPRLLYPDLYPELFNVNVVAGKNNIRKAIARAKDAFRVATTGVPIPGNLVSSAFDTNFKPSNRLVKLGGRFTIFSEILDMLARDSEANSQGVKEVRHYGFIVLADNRGGVMLKHDDENWYGLTEDQLAMIASVARQRFTLQLLIEVGSIGKVDELAIWDWISWQELCLILYGNRGFDMVKGPEALMKAVNLHLGDGVIPGMDPLTDMLEKYRAKELVMTNGHGSPQSDRLKMLCRNVKDDDTCLAVFSLAKICGHPLLDVEESARSMSGLGKAQGVFSARGLMELEATVKFLIIEAQLKKGSWPQFEIPPQKGTKLYTYYSARSVTLEYESCPLADYTPLRFRKIYDCKPPADGLQLFDDKTIAGYDSTIIPNMLRPQSGASSTRLIEATLMGGEVDLDDVYHKFQSGIVPKEWLVIAITLKGGELKPIGRGFAMFCKEIRALLSDMERRLSEGIMSDISYQTMTLGKKETTVRLCGATWNEKALQVESDLSRWNLRWKKPVVNVIGGILDQIYDMPGVWSRLHTLFEECTIIMRMPGYMPAGARRGLKISELDEQDLIWRNHTSGFEGQAQKLWTLATIAMMLMGSRGMDCSVLLTGQGDNQIEEITRGKTDRRPDADFMRDYLSRKARVCSSVGQELKPEECIVGKRRTTYSKYFYQDGYERIPPIKTALKMYNPPSDGLRALSSRLENIGASALSCAPSFPNPLTALFLYQVGAIILLQSEMVTNSHNCRDYANTLVDDFSTVAAIPSCIGGFTSINPISVFYKGYTDAPGLSLSQYYMTGRFSEAVVASSLDLGGKEPDLRRLVDDPLSFPINRSTTTPGTCLDRYTRSIVRGMAHGEGAVAAAIRAGTDEDYETIARSLTQMRPFMPLIARTIMDATVPGVSRALMGRLKSTKTILSRASQVLDISPYSAVQMADRKVLRYLVDLHRSAKLNPSRTLGRLTGYELVERFRRLWGIDSKGCNLVTGVTTVPVTDLLLRTPQSRRMMFHNRVAPSQDTGPIRRRAYRGPGTGQKRAYGSMSVAIDSQAMRDLKDLSLVLSQANPGPGLRGLIRQVMQTRTLWNVDTILPLLPTVVGGTAAHRHNVMGRAAFDIGTVGREPHTIRISSDDIKLTGDYPLAFQEAYCFGVTVASCMIRVNSKNELTRFDMWVDLTGVPEIVDESPDIPPGGDIPSAPPPNRITTAEIRSVVDRATNLPAGATEQWIVPQILGFEDRRLLVEAKALAVLGQPPVLASLPRRELPSGTVTQFIDRQEYEIAGHMAVAVGLGTAVARLSLYVAATNGEAGYRSYPLLMAINDLSALAVKLVEEHARRNSSDPWLSQRGVEYTTGEGGLIAFRRRYIGLIANMALQLIESYRDSLVAPVPVFEADGAPGFIMQRVFIASAFHIDMADRQTMLRAACVRSLWLRLAQFDSSEIGLVGPALGLIIQEAGGRTVTFEHVRRALGDGDGAFLIIPGTPVESLRRVRGGKPDPPSSNHPYYLKGRSTDPVQVKMSTGSTGKIALQWEDQEKLSVRDYLWRSFDRHTRMVGGVHTGAGCQWSGTRLLDEVKGRYCYVAGAGNGALMALIDRCGGVVTGLDLLSNVPDDVDIMSYAPPETRATGRPQKLDVDGMLLGGDWFTVGRDRVMTVKPSIVIVDLESGSRGPEEDLAVLAGCLCTVYYRFFATTAQAAQLYGCFRDSNPLLWAGSTYQGGNTWILRYDGYTASHPLRHTAGSHSITRIRRLSSRLYTEGTVIIKTALESAMPRSVTVNNSSINRALYTLAAIHRPAVSDIRNTDLSFFSICVSCIGCLLAMREIISDYCGSDASDFPRLTQLCRDIAGSNRGTREFNGRDYPITRKSMIIACKAAGRYIAGCEEEEITLQEALNGFEL